MTVDKSRTFLQRIGDAREINVLGFVLAAGLIIYVLNPTFLTVFNIQVIMRQVAVFGILAIAETFVIIALGIDLSVGSIVAFVGIITALMMNWTGNNIFISVMVALITASLIGLYHGVFVTRVGVAPFIITLGSLSIFRGAAYVLTRGYPVLIRDEAFRWLGQGLIGPLPVPFVVLLVVAVVTGFILQFTSLGRYIYAIGGNPEAARMSGVPVTRVTTFVYIQASFLAGVVGVLIASRMSEGLASVAGGYELTAIAAAIIGGTSLAGGIGSVRGALLGAILMGMIDNALITLRVNAYWYNLVIGAVIIVAVTIDVLRTQGQRAA
jgi:ribose transport system permease protein